MSPALIAVFAVACGAIVANLYYAQALIGLIAPAIGLASRMAGFTVTLTQLGYCAGLLLIVSLADLVENRRLALTMLAGVIASLVGVATAHSATTFLIFSFLTGFCCVGAQILVPFAAHMATDANALLAAILAFVIAGWSGVAVMLVVLAAGAILLDGATQFNQVVSQRVIYSIAPEARGRITSIFMTTVFVGGAIGSSMAPVILIGGGWLATMLTGAAAVSVAFLLFLTERRM
ncbi:MAG: hypothetical protein M3Z05_11425 [Gemmatimonadota bacterium]|nr:hypothetical protein [Gemmatimonadota bacterium]